MALFERDHITRLVKQLGEALGRIHGLRQHGKHKEALEVVDGTLHQLLGEVVALADRVDVDTAAQLLGERERMEAYAALVAARSDTLADMGEGTKAERERLRALQMYLLAVRRGPRLVDERTRQAIQALRPKVDESVLREQDLATLKAVG